MEREAFVDVDLAFLTFKIFLQSQEHTENTRGTKKKQQNGAFGKNTIFGWFKTLNL